MPEIPVVLLMQDTSDPYWRDMVELGGRVADAFDVHGTDERSILEYLEYWFEIAGLNASL